MLSVLRTHSAAVLIMDIGRFSLPKCRSVFDSVGKGPLLSASVAHPALCGMRGNTRGPPETRSTITCTGVHFQRVFGFKRENFNVRAVGLTKLNHFSAIVVVIKRKTIFQTVYSARKINQKKGKLFTTRVFLPKWSETKSVDLRIDRKAQTIGITLRVGVEANRKKGSKKVVCAKKRRGMV